VVKGDFVFAIPGDPDTATGGYIYDKRMIAELRELGWRPQALNLGDGFPKPNALTLAAFLLTAGSLGDRLGRRRVFALGFAIFTFASFLCGIAGDPTLLNLARGLQGVGGAAMFATSLALIGQEFHGKDRATAFGVWGGAGGAASAADHHLQPQRNRAGQFLAG
jgi:hypothetical protein